MSKKNEFELFCDELPVTQMNKVDYVRNQLREKYQNNTDKYLMIKAEAQEDDFMQYSSIRISMLALIFSFFGVMVNLLPQIDDKLLDLGVKLIYLLFIIFTTIKIGWRDKFSSVRKWRKYILVIIDDLIEESIHTDSTSNKKEKTKGKKKSKKSSRRKLGGCYMKRSNEEYLMLRDEILHLSNMENNIMNFFYVSVATIMAFSLTQQDTIFILLPYIIIIPAYRLVLSKMKGIYKIGAYMYVFLEGKTFNWERRTSKFYRKLPNTFGGKVQSFNWPFLFTSVFVTIVFILRTEWMQIFDEVYEGAKVIMAALLFIVILSMILKNRRFDIHNYLSCWEDVKSEEK